MAKLLPLMGLALVLVLGGASLVVAQSGTVQEQEGEDTGEAAGACPSPGALMGTPDEFAEASPTADVPEAFDADASPVSSPGATGGVATPPNIECPSPEAGS